MAAAADRNLLFGILAMQMEFITRAKLIKAMQAWIFDKKKTLGEILVAQKALAADDVSLIDSMVDQHMADHGHNIEKSLSAISAATEVRTELESIGDPDLQTCLSFLPGGKARSSVSATEIPVAASLSATEVPAVASNSGAEFLSAPPASTSGTELLSGASPSRTAVDAYATIAPGESAAGTPASSLSPSKTAVDEYATVMPGAEGIPSLTPKPLPGVGVMRFRLVRPHARGGLGEVFVAHDEELHREVALKEILERAADNPEYRTRFMLEAEITGGLEHPGIVPVYGLGTYEDGRPYYAMRFIRGESLKEAIDRFHKADKNSMTPGQRALELRGLLRRIVDCCDAIGYAHSRGVLHRDIKPGNIMLGKFGETLVVDWGLAKPQGAPVDESKANSPGESSLTPASMNATTETMHGAAVGTPQYMSPEQAAGKLDQLGPPSDVYSLGATLFCVLTGQAPIKENDVNKVIQRVQRGEIRKAREVNPEVPRTLDAICTKSMALEIKDRYQTTRELGDDLEHWLADEPVSAWKEPWTTVARRWIGRHATLVTSVGSAVVVALVGLIVAAVLLNAAKLREEAAKEKAEENFQLARSAVDTYHTRVSEDDLLNEPGMQPLRKRLLESASEYYEKFIKDRAGDPSVRGELGKATFRLAQITGEIKSNPEAIDLHEKALTIFAELPKDKMTDEYRADQAECYHHLGRLYRLTGKLDKSYESYGKAVELWDPLAQKSAETVRFQAGLARTKMGMGNAQQEDRKLDAARENYEKSLNAWAALKKAHPKNHEFDREVSVNYSNLGQIYQSLSGKGKEAKDSLQTAFTIQKKLASDAPNVGKYQNDFAATCFLLARSMLASPETKDEAKPLYLEAVDRWHTLTQQQPAVIVYHSRLAEAYLDLANLYRGENDFAEADAVCRKAVAIQRKLADENKDDGRYQSTLARGLVVQANVFGANPLKDRSTEVEAAYEEAILIQEKLAKGKGAPPTYQRDLAQTYQSVGSLNERKLRDEKAASAYQNAVALWQKLAQDYPEDSEYTLGLANSFVSLGNVAKLVGDFKKADGYYSQALTGFEQKGLKSLDTPQVKFVLLSAHSMRGDMRTQLQRHDEALADWNRAFELAPPAQKPLIQISRGAAFARVGKYTEAIAEVEPIVAKAKTGPIYYRFACVYAPASGAARDRKDLSDEYAAQAISLLTKARDAKFFNSLNNQMKLFVEPDLEPLRARPEFKKLASEFKVE